MSHSIEQMLEKFKSYKKSYLEHQEGFKDLVKHGQHPETLIITCVDSRIDPAILFNSALGDLLVIRTKANIIPAYDPNYHRDQIAAVLEFAVTILEVKNIIVMGHSDCGGINFLMNQIDNISPKESFISGWLEPLLPLKQHILETHPDASNKAQCQACEKANLIQSFEHLKTYPWISPRLENHTLHIFGWYFNLATCAIERYIPETKQFQKEA